MKCSVRECQKGAWQTGLCSMHYSRLRKHGNLDASRPKDWGSRKKHNLYNAWRELVRKKEKSRSEVWDDFWKFVEDVGDRPTDDHVLARFREDEPFGPSNFFWREKVTVIGRTESRKEYRARYQREYRKLHPERMKKYETKRHFGLEAGGYEKMLEAQSGLCAICLSPEESKHSDGRTKSLSVDHCHSTGKVRGLLCTNCNNGLGRFKDNPDYLQAAIQYLKSHSEEVRDGFKKEDADAGSQAEEENVGSEGLD